MHLPLHSQLSPAPRLLNCSPIWSCLFAVFVFTLIESVLAFIFHLTFSSIFTRLHSAVVVSNQYDFATASSQTYTDYSAHNVVNIQIYSSNGLLSCSQGFLLSWLAHPSPSATLGYPFSFFLYPFFFCYSQLSFCRHYLPTLLPRWHSLNHTTSPLLNRSLLYSSSPLHVARQKQSLAFLHSHTSPHLLSQHFNVCRRSGKKSKQKVATGLGCSAHPLDGCVLFICVFKNGM